MQKKDLRKFGLMVAMAGIVLVSAGCNPESNSTTPVDTSSTQPDNQVSQTPADSTSESGDVMTKTDTAVTIQNYSFSPSKITVKKGTTITWTNQDDVRHNVVVTAGSGPKSELLAKGQTYSYTFNDVGTFNYICEPHPYMKASVEVTE